MTRSYGSHSKDTQEAGTWSRILWALLGFIALAGLAYGVVKFVGTRTSRQTANVAELNFTRDALQKPAAIDPEMIFDEKTVTRLNNGNGLTADFTITFRDTTEWHQKFEIENLHITGNTDWPTRRKNVREKIAEFQKIAGEYAAYRPRTWTIEVYFDDTEGVTRDQSVEVLHKLDDLDIPGILQRGDSVDFYCYRLSDAFFVNERHISLTPKSPPAAFYDPLMWLMQPRPSKSQSSTFIGFFNAASQNNGKPNRTLLVFTYWLENSQFGNFYKQPPKQEEYGKVVGKFTAVRAVPDFKGAEVLSFAPHNAVDAKQIDLSQKFAEAIFRQAGAWQVKMVY